MCIRDSLKQTCKKEASLNRVIAVAREFIATSNFKWNSLTPWIFSGICLLNTVGSKPILSIVPEISQPWRRVFRALGCLLFGLFVSFSVHSQSNDRGLHRAPLVVTTQSGNSVELYHQSHALLIEVSEYENGWSSLSSIPGELDQVERVLRKKNFNVVRLKNPDDKELRAGIVGFINQYGFEPGNRLLFFFSGHGHTIGNTGYLVPANSPLPEDNANFRRRALSMNQIMA